MGAATEGQRENIMIELDLQLFAEGEQGSADAGAGVDTGAGGNGSQAGTEQAATPTLTPYQQMIQGEGKAEYERDVGQRIQSAIQQRFRNQRDAQRQLTDYNPILQELGRRYGVDPSDAKGLYAKMTDDLSLYQAEADKMGTTPETVRTMHKLRAETEQAKAKERMATEELNQQRENRRIAEQAVQLKQTFPGFDLMAEMGNPRFERMVRGGLSVKDAFYALHGEEIQRQSMQYAAQQAGQRIAASVQAGASRPIENGMQRNNPVNIGVDIAHMDKKTREAYRQRIRNGETIDFRNKL